MAVWPATLPAIGHIGATVTADDAVVRSTMDAGPPSRRNRYTAVTKMVSCTMLLTGTQVSTLRVFFRDTLRNGAFDFEWTDPIDDSTVRMAFKQPPEFTNQSGNAAPSARFWSVSLSLEIQP